MDTAGRRGIESCDGRFFRVTFSVVQALSSREFFPDSCDIFPGNGDARPVILAVDVSPRAAFSNLIRVFMGNDTQVVVRLMFDNGLASA